MTCYTPSYGGGEVAVVVTIDYLESDPFLVSYSSPIISSIETYQFSVHYEMNNEYGIVEDPEDNDQLIYLDPNVFGLQLNYFTTTSALV